MPSVVGFLLLGLMPGIAPAEPFFETDIRPILKIYCLDCHGASEKPSGGLDLRLVRFAKAGGKHGSSLKLGDPAGSLILERMRNGEMPPGEKKVPAEQIALMESWIRAGAPTKRSEPEKLEPGLGITWEERAYWFFQPLRRPETPGTPGKDRVRTPIDAFILKKLNESGSGFAPDADKGTLILRVALDLTGLPPTDAERKAFEADQSPDAYEKMVERYLASSSHGERWARHWLDVFGYADSDGDGTTDTPRPHAFRFRDYVIRSVESDKSLSRMFLEMLAGDELVSKPIGDLTAEQVDLLAATGFLRMGPDATAGGGEAILNIDQAIADSLKIVSSSLLGLSVGCAQCHDHKYDPVSQADYFRLRAIFDPAWNPKGWKVPAARVVSLTTRQQREIRAKVETEEKEAVGRREKRVRELVEEIFEREIAKLPESQRASVRSAYRSPAEKRTPEQKKLVAENPRLNISVGILDQFSPEASKEVKELDRAIQAIRSKKPVEEFVAGLVEDPGVRVETRIHYRGDPRQQLSEVQPADLSIASLEGKRSDFSQKDPSVSTTGRRLSWARHLFSGSHPLVGRVLANRIWLGHFGRGIVDTPGDFGKLGMAPSHPELLDWLATELAGAGWSAKAIHRDILKSTVYRQSAKAAGSEPYSRFPVKRLEAEALRDRILSATGELDLARFGPAVVTAEDGAGLANAVAKRRAIYLQVRRSKPETMLAAFDLPFSGVNCEKRQPATSAMQALVMMNGDFVRQSALAMADRVIKESGPNEAARIGRAVEIAYCREATNAERGLMAMFMSAQTDILKREGCKDDPARVVLSHLCQQLMASSEFLHAP